jgi:hypothetical protein
MCSVRVICVISHAHSVALMGFEITESVANLPTQFSNKLTAYDTELYLSDRLK